MIILKHKIEADWFRENHFKTPPANKQNDYIYLCDKSRSYQQKSYRKHLFGDAWKQVPGHIAYSHWGGGGGNDGIVVLI